MKKLAICSLAIVMLALVPAAAAAGPTCKAGETYDTDKKRCVAG
jgi:hypothetical protein